ASPGRRNFAQWKSSTNSNPLRAGLTPEQSVILDSIGRANSASPSALRFVKRTPHTSTSVPASSPIPSLKPNTKRLSPRPAVSLTHSNFNRAFRFPFPPLEKRVRERRLPSLDRFPQRQVCSRRTSRHLCLRPVLPLRRRAV